MWWSVGMVSQRQAHDHSAYDESYQLLRPLYSKCNTKETERGAVSTVAFGGRTTARIHDVVSYSCLPSARCRQLVYGVFFHSER